MAPHTKPVVPSISVKVGQYLKDCFSTTSAWKQHEVLRILLENDTNANATNMLKSNVFSTVQLDDVLAEAVSYYFVFFPNKHPCKTLLRSVIKQCDENTMQSSFVEKAFTSLCNSVTTLDVTACHIIQTYQMCVNSLWMSPECFISLVVSSAVDVVIRHSSMLSEPLKLSTEITHILNLISEDLKCINTFLHKRHQEFKSCQMVKTLHRLEIECKTLLSQEHCRGNCWNAAALLLPTVVFLISSKSFYLMATILFSLDKNVCKSELDSLSSSAKLAVCNGILVFVSYKNVDLAQVDSEMLESTNSTLHKILKLAFNWLNVVLTSVVGVQDEIDIGRCVLQWSTALSTHIEIINVKTEEFASYLHWILPYTNIGLDHSTDLLRHQARDVLQNILQAAHNFKQVLTDVKTDFIQEILAKVISGSWDKRAIYVSLNCILKHSAPSTIMQRKPDIVTLLFEAMSDQSLVPYASNLYLGLAKASLDNGHNRENVYTEFLLPILTALKSSNEHNLRLLLDYCLRKVLKLFGTGGLNFIISNVKTHQNMGLNILIMCLSTAQQLGLLQDTVDCAERGTWKSGVNVSVLKQALVHPSGQLRLDAYSLICQSCKPSELISAVELDLIKNSLPYSMTSQCPAFRQQLLNMLKKLISRINLNYTKVFKELSKKTPIISSVKLNSVKSIYEDFVRWLVDTCFNQLFDGACYSRRNICLTILSNVLDTLLPGKGLCPHLSEIITKERIETLCGMMYDNYEENRELALHLLLSNNAAAVKKHFADNLAKKTASAIKLCQKTYKPEECKDAAYDLRLVIALADDSTSETLRIIGEILSNLQADVQLAKQNLLQSLSRSSLYGNLYCIRMLLVNTALLENSEWRKCVSKCIDASIAVFDAVFPVVGSISPEGHLPDVLESDPESNSWDNLPDFLRPLVDNTLVSNVAGDVDERLAAQRVLVSCWRSAKESSLLLQTIATVCPCDATENLGDALLSWQQLLDIGLHLRRQLMNARHRGAFEIAYSAFKAYCPLLWRKRNRQLSRYLIEWLNSVVEDVCDPVKSKLLCSTRRSAGLPFLAQALLSSDKGNEIRACLRHVMASLLMVLESDSNYDTVSKVHALNVAQGLIRDASLGEEVGPYLSLYTITAIKGIACRVWSIRNSSTLLFSALVTRIFGVKREKDLESSAKNRMSSHEFFTRLPQLREFLLDHLDRNTTADESSTLSTLKVVRHTEMHSRIYPDLLLLSRLYPSSNSPHSLDDFVPCLTRCLGSSIFKIRSMAATALSCVVKTENIGVTITFLCDSLKSFSSQNDLHGRLMALGQLHAKRRSTSCKNSPINTEHALAFLTDLLPHSWLASRRNPCPMTRAIYLELLVQVVEDIKNSSDNDLHGVTSELSDLRADVKGCVAERGVVGQSFCDRAVGRAVVYFYIWKLSPPSDVCSVLISPRIDLKISALEAFLHLASSGNPLDPSDRKKLFQAVASLTATEKDQRTLRLAYENLPHLTSASNCGLSIERGLRLAEDLSPNNCLLSSVAVAVARCINLALSENEKGRGRVVESYQRRWMQLATQVFDPRIKDNADVRQAITGCFDAVAFQLLSADPAQEPSPFVAWRLLFAMLIDEDESTRSQASLLVHKVALQCGLKEGVPFVDSLALETAADCLFKLLGTKHAEQCRNILRDVSNCSSVNEDNIGGAKESRVFDRGEGNTYTERHVIECLARRFADGAAT